MELRQLEIFRVLAHELNFTRTAERVHCVQSNVTVQIRALEAELGVVLFDRTGKQVRLTAAGERLLPYAERVLGLVEEAKSRVSMPEEPQGVLRIGVPESVLTYRLPPVLQALRERHPAVELSFLTDTCAKLWGMARRDAVDLVFTINDTVEQPQLQIHYLCGEAIVFVARADHPLALRSSVECCDLQTETMLMTEEDCSYRQRLEQIMAAAAVKPAAVLTFTSVEAIKQCAVLGLGIAYLPRMTVLAELAAGSLAVLPWTGPSPSMKTLVAWHREKWHSPAMSALLTIVRERFVLEPAG